MGKTVTLQEAFTSGRKFRMQGGHTPGGHYLSTGHLWRTASRIIPGGYPLKGGLIASGYCTRCTECGNEQSVGTLEAARPWVLFPSADECESEAEDFVRKLTRKTGPRLPVAVTSDVGAKDE